MSTESTKCRWATLEDPPVSNAFLETDGSNYYLERNNEAKDKRWYMVERDPEKTYYREDPKPKVIAGPFDDLDEAKATYLVIVRMEGLL
jgi:hypothetical protein